MTRHIVWDWNGTLFNDSETVYRVASELFVTYGLPRVSAARYREAYCRPIPEFYARLFGRTLAEAEFAGMDDDFHQAYSAALPTVTLADGAVDVLRSWRAGGRTQSLLSMFPHDRLVPLVRGFELEAEFTLIDGLRLTGGGHKSRFLYDHIAVQSLSPADVLVVGDSLDDAHAADDVGAACVLYNGGAHDRAALEATGLPVADTLAEALSHVGQRSAPRRATGRSSSDRRQSGVSRPGRPRRTSGR